MTKPSVKNNISEHECKPQDSQKTSQYDADQAKQRYREQVRIRVARFRAKNPERMRQIQKRYWDKNPEKYLEKTKRYQTKFPKKLEAQKLVNLAIKKGELKRLPCQHCGNPKSEGHHVDYSKPLEIQWLCKKHHMKWHQLFIAIGGE